jgi:hypothetical protein
MMAKVAAAVEDPSDERGEHAERGRENDQSGGGVERGARFVQHVGFAFHDLADGADVGEWQKLRETRIDASTSADVPLAATSMVEGAMPVQF